MDKDLFQDSGFPPRSNTQLLKDIYFLLLQCNNEHQRDATQRYHSHAVGGQCKGHALNTTMTRINLQQTFIHKISLPSQLFLQAMAATGQTAAHGDGRHRGQTAPHGGKEAKHPQVCPHSLRPGHGPPEPREGKPQLHSIQFYMKT